jgi:ribosome-binding protein aMBF1 (putative translation factor)
VRNDWTSIRNEATNRGRSDEARIVHHKERGLSAVRAQRLAEIRAGLGFNQTALAARLAISQPRLSRIERGDIDTTQVATLRAYIEALGGRLEVTAKFGDNRIIVID